MNIILNRSYESISGGLGKAGKVFGDKFSGILNALTKELVA